MLNIVMMVEEMSVFQLSLVALLVSNLLMESVFSVNHLHLLYKLMEPF